MGTRCDARGYLLVENKKTDAVTNKDKESAWKTIENSFNSCGVSTCVRSWKTLKLKYEGIKKTMKKKSSVQRQEMYRTGGGTSNAPDFNNVEEKVLSICSNIKGLEARNDSDTIVIVEIPDEEGVLKLNTQDDENKDTTEANVKIPDMDESFILDIRENNDSQKENDEFFFPDDKEDVNTGSQKEHKWDKWHPKALKTKVSQVLKSDAGNKASVTSKLDKLSAARLELVRLQMETTRKQHQFIEDEHKLKMVFIEDEHKLKMVFIEDEHKLKMVFIEDEHKLKMVFIEDEHKLKMVFIEDEHKLKMVQLVNDERRKEEIHNMLLQKIASGPVSHDMI